MDINDWLMLVPSVFGVAAAVATVTPTKADDKIVNGLFKLVHTLGLNFGRAKNKE